MTDEQWRDAWRLYQSGRSLDQEQLDSLLAGSSADAEVHAAVLAMLDKHPPGAVLDPAGQKIGRYLITERLGAGGMGEVYAARDLELGRLAAVKFLTLPEAGKSSSLDRFVHEAKAASALNHPNIVTIYEVIQAPPRLAIMMELVEGKPLRHLCGSPLPLDRILDIGAQIAQALAAAHARGIVHCDIKPENLMLRRDGLVKVLDFGLALDLENFRSSSVLPAGTLQYMSPERSRGELPSAATDIFAFGVILYELATGKHPFARASLLDTLQSINDADPPPPSRSNSYVPPQMDALILKMLSKDAALRPTASEVASAMESRLEGAPVWISPPNPPSAGRLSGKWFRASLRWLLPAMCALAAAAFAWFYRPVSEPAVVRFSFTPPFRSSHVNLAVSPDGTRIAFTDLNGEGGIFLRSTNSLSVEKVPGTELALSFSWSPDGKEIAFIGWAYGLRKVNLANGASPSQTITPVASNYTGSAWGSSGVILYVPQATGKGLFGVPASGGTPFPVTHLDPARKEISHRYPQFLPGGKRFLYWSWSAIEENTGVYIGSLDPADKLPPGLLVRSWREARFSDSGHLLFMDGATLMARPFDADKLAFTGDAVALREPAGLHWESTGRAMFSVAGSRALVYQEFLPPPRTNIVIRDRTGKEQRRFAAPAVARYLSLNRQGTQLIFQAVDENTLEALWTLDLARGITARLTSSRASDQRPTWSHDGRRIAFHSNRSGAYEVYARNVEDSGDEERLTRSPSLKTPESWSPDGRFLLYTDLVAAKGDLWAIPMDGDRKPLPIVNTAANEYFGRLSPVKDSLGRTWLIYASEKTGVAEIYMRPFLPTSPGKAEGAELRVSANTGSYPHWRSDGKELFYIETENGKNRFMAVDVQFSNPPVVSAPRPVFEWNPRGLPGYAVLADGRSFAVAEANEDEPVARINVVLNWTEGLKR